MNAFGIAPFRSRTSLFFLLLAMLPCTLSASAKKPKPVAQWTGTWRTALFALGAPAGLAPHAEGESTGLGRTASTLRQTVHVSLGGTLVRVELSNVFGTEPLVLDSVHIALAGATPGTIQLPTANALTFGGLPHVTIAPGGSVFSDPAALALKAGDNLVISMLVPAQTISEVTGHSDAFQTNYLAEGDRVGARSLSTGDPEVAAASTAQAQAPQPQAGPTQPAAPLQTLTHWLFLQGVEVKTPDEPALPRSAVVAFGDSITDGARSTDDANARWPDVLARRLAGNKATDRVAVLNAGIGGNRVLHDNRGPRASARFDRDVLQVAGVRFVVILEGINDIGAATGPQGAHDPVSADDLIAGLTELAKRAHAKELRVIGGTLTPYAGAGYFSPAGETIRQTVNAWIRTAPVFDSVIDFDKVTRDPAHADQILAAYDSGDHLHPNDAGYQAMGESIDLKLFASGAK